jgi:signal transduction histidine kinase
LVRLLSAYQRGATLLILLSLSLGALLGAALTLGAKRTLHGNEPEAKSRDHDMSSLAGLAKVSVEQGVQLERERNERLRIQEDLNLQQSLLNRSLEEKIRLGHDLHDGIIQSLYATGLTLEAARRSTESNPAAAAQQVDTALEMLNRTIRDVRSYILGLAPENLRSQSFSEAVRSIAETVGAGSGVEFGFDVDSDSAARLNEAQYADLVQVVREAVSNAIRHGKAKRIEVTLKGTGNEFCLAVRDNGRGFSIENASRGHGLNNIQSRAQRLGAQLQFSSTPGTGTRIVVTFRTP